VAELQMGTCRVLDSKLSSWFNLSSGVDERQKMFDLHRFYRTTRGYGNDFLHTWAAKDHVTATTAGRTPLNAIRFGHHL